MDRLQLLIIGSNNKATGGIPRYIPEQLQYLSDTIEPTVYDIGAPEGSGLNWFVKSFILAVADAVMFPFTDRPDVVHVHTSQAFSFYRASFYVLFARYIWHTPVILHIHGSTFDEFVDTDSPISRRLQSLVYSAADEVIVLSAYWQKELQRYIDQEKITVIPNAVDPEEYSPSFDPTPAHIMFVSDLIPRKGVKEFLEAIEIIQQKSSSNLRISIAGKGPLSTDVDKTSEKYGDVEYLGYISEEEKREMLSKGSIYVLPSYAEGLPISLLEAMAGGNAVVTTKVGSIPEVITSENGILVEPGDADQLADALLHLLESPETVERMAHTNRDVVETKYSWSSVSNQLQERYQAHVTR